MYCIRLWFVWLLVVLSNAGFAGDSTWTVNGPLGGGVFHIAFNPLDSQVAYATTRGGVYKTTDAGANWARKSDGIVATSVYPLPLVLDIEAPNTLYTFDSSLRLYRSQDGAANWQILATNLDPDFLFQTMSDVAGESGSIFIGGVSQTVTGLPQLFKSNNRGEVFTRVGTGLPADARIASITVDSLNPNLVYVGIYGAGAVNQASLFRSTNGGVSFAPRFNLFSALGYQPDVQDLSFIAGTGANVTGSLFAVINFNLYHSADGGANWTGPYGPAATVTADPINPLKVFIGRADGAFIWTAPPSPTFTDYNQGLTPNASYISMPGNIPIRAAISRLVVQPGFPAPSRSLYASTDGSGVFTRADGASNWRATGNPAGVGVRALAIHAHPSLSNAAGSNLVLAGHSSFAVSSPGLYRSINQALSWTPLNLGLRAIELRSVLIDATTLGGNIANSVLYAGGASATVDGAYSGAGIFRSVDNGANWLPMDGDLPLDTTLHANIGLIRNLTLDPRSCSTPPLTGPCTSGGLRQIYALAQGRSLDTARVPLRASSVFTHRIVRSNNFGVSWTLLDAPASGLPASFINDDVAQRITPNTLAIDPNNSSVLYLGTDATYDDLNSNDAIVPADLASGVFKSVNAGSTWQHLIANGLPTKTGFSNTQLDVAKLLIDPSNSNVLWAALTDLRSSGFSSIFRSSDSGASWTRYDDGINGSVELRSLAFDPQNPNILYAAAGGFEANPGAIYRGVWNASTQSIVWLSISVGLPAESAYVVSVDPFNANVLHAGTDIGVASITRAPDQDNDGVPDAAENLAPDVPGGLVGLGDGNSDGVFDALQRDVGSIGVLIRRAEGGSLRSVTTDIISGAGAPGCSNGTAQAVDAQLLGPNELGLDSVAGGTDYYRHSLGINRFEVLGCTSASIRIRYHGASFTSPLWTFRIFAPLVPGDQNGIKWHDFSASASRISADTWQVNLTAGGFGSYRPDSDAIYFIGGPACYEPTLFRDGFEDASGNGPICSD